ncbi:YggL family protein [Neisseriaceae bacterium TC5R-5]|nr:YggL family protein [Neisseriaceae bacterium TC5R-5]
MSAIYNPHSRQRLKRLNTRQRKKTRVGEYCELGFHLLAELNSVSDEQADALLDAWLDLVDAKGISFGGHYDGHGKLEGVAFPVAAIKIDEALRSELLAWLQARSEVKSLEAGELIDLWHKR